MATSTELSPPLRLLFLMRDHLPPFRPDVAVLFGKELPRLGIASDLLGQRGAESAPGVSWPAGQMHVSGEVRQGALGDLFRSGYDVRLLCKLAAAHDLIQVRDKVRGGVLALLLARLSGKPFAYWMSFPFVEGYRERSRQVASTQGRMVQVLNALRASLASFAYYRLVVPHVDHLFVQSEAMLDFMAAKGVPRSRMSAVPMGVDLDNFDQIRKPARLPARMQGRRVIAYLGTLGQSRQSDFLLEVLCRVRQEEPQALLLLAGDGASPDEQQWMRRRIAEEGLQEHVWLTGWLPQADILPLVACADVGLSPVPRGELFDVSSPTKAVEYLALGLPCVGNDIPDQRLVLEASGGGACVPMQAEAFAEAVLALLRDPQRAAQCGASGREWVRTHRSYRVIAQTVAASYRRILQERQSCAA